MMDGNELDDLRELVEFLKANEIAEFEVEKDDLKLRLKFAGAAGAAAATSGVDMAQLARLMASGAGTGAGSGGGSGSAAVGSMEVAQAALAKSETPAAAVVAEVKHHVVKSPIVGTFYESPSPGSPPFVKVGDVVEVGQVLCIVEAMKLMNEIESDAAGEVMERIATVGQPVEYGQALFAIRAR